MAALVAQPPRELAGHSWRDSFDAASTIFEAASTIQIDDSRGDVPRYKDSVHNHKMAPTVSQPTREPARHSLRDSSSFSEHRRRVSVQVHSPFHLGVVAEPRIPSGAPSLSSPARPSTGSPSSRPPSSPAATRRNVRVNVPILARTASCQDIAASSTSGRVSSAKPVVARTVSYQDVAGLRHTKMSPVVARTASCHDVAGLQVDSAATIADDTPWPPPTSSPRSPPRGVDALLFIKAQHEVRREAQEEEARRARALRRVASAPSFSTAGRVSSSKTLKPFRTASERGALNYVKEQEFLMESARALSMSLKEGGREGEMARTPSMRLNRSKAHRPVEAEEGGKSPYERGTPVRGRESAQLAVFLSVQSWGASCHQGTARYGGGSPPPSPQEPSVCSPPRPNPSMSALDRIPP